MKDFKNSNKIEITSRWGKRKQRKGEIMHLKKNGFEMSISGLNISFWISKNDNGSWLTNVQMLWNGHKASSSKSSIPTVRS
jgi:hypothetical protein